MNILGGLSSESKSAKIPGLSPTMTASQVAKAFGPIFFEADNQGDTGIKNAVRESSDNTPESIPVPKGTLV